MKKRIIIFIFALVIISIGWYLLSPLFTNTVVEEEFPFAVEDLQEEANDMEKQMKMFEELTPEQVDAMPEDERMEMQKKMDEVGKSMPDSIQEESEPADGPQIVAQGQFRDADSFHQGSGDATIYSLQDGSHVLRFENFSVTNGPALSVFLTKSSDGTKDADAVNLGKLKGNKGSQNYTIPADVDLSEYKAAIVYCVPFRVLFAVASLEM